MRYTRFGCLAVTVLVMQAAVAFGQSGARFGFDAGAGFATVHANASPGNCGCFFMLGGTAHASLLEAHGLATVVDAGVTHKSNINGNNYQITLQTYTFGERYEREIGHKLAPFVQALAGFAHSQTDYQVDNNKTGFAALAGGGLDVRLSPRVDLRLFEADYLPNRIPNGANRWQNQLRLTTGIVYRFKER